MLASRHGNRLHADRFTLVIRCPYCLVGIEFRPMIAYKDGRFVCRDCAHAVRPGVPEYRCACRPCLNGGTRRVGERKPHPEECTS